MEGVPKRDAIVTTPPVAPPHATLSDKNFPPLCQQQHNTKHDDKNDEMRKLLDEIISLSDIWNIKALISRVRQIKSELKDAGSHSEQLRVCFKYTDVLNGLYLVV